jgi:hypothetical protein
MEVGSIDVTEDWCLLREEWPIHKSRRGSQGIEAGLSTRCSKRHVMLREKGKVLKEKEKKRERKNRLDARSLCYNNQKHQYDDEDNNNGQTPVLPSFS